MTLQGAIIAIFFTTAIFISFLYDKCRVEKVCAVDEDYGTVLPLYMYALAWNALEHAHANNRPAIVKDDVFVAIFVEIVLIAQTDGRGFAMMTIPACGKYGIFALV